MRAPYSFLITVLLVVPALLVGAVGQPEELPMPEEPPAAAEPLGVPREEGSWVIQRATEVVGLPVLDWEDQQVGQAADVAMDLGSGLVRYVIFRFADLPEADPEALYPVPLRYLQFDPQRGAFLANVDQAEVVRSAPTLEQVRDAAMGRYLWDITYSTYWRSTVGPMTTREQLATVPEQPFYWATGTRVLPGSMALFSDLEGRGVNSPGGVSLGRVEDLTFRLDDGTVGFVVMEPVASISGPAVPLPLSLLTLESLEGELVADAGPGEIRNAPSLAGEPGPELARADYRERVRTYWHGMVPATSLRPGMRVLPGTTMRASLLLGLGVTNPEGESLGDLVDLVIERSGQVPYAVVEFGDVLGFGGRWYYIPMGALSIDRANRLAILDVDQRMLEAMPGYPRGSLPETSSPDWDLEIRAYWEEYLTPVSQQVVAELAAREQERRTLRLEKPGAILASELQGYGVINPLGDDLGEVEGLMIDLEATRLAYPIISFGGVLGFGAKRFPVPPDRFTVNTFRDALVLSVEPELFRRAPGYQQDRWPDSADRFWRRTIDEYWQRPS